MVEGDGKNVEFTFNSVMVTLAALLPTLGTPPLDIALGRPTVATAQPAYARYHSFMLRYSGRSVESILSGRMIYDGGEAKDGTPVICMIMRNINIDTVDQDLLLYCFLKVRGQALSYMILLFTFVRLLPNYGISHSPFWLMRLVTA